MAAIGVPLCAAIVYAGGFVFALGLGAVAAVGYGEFASMYREGPYRPFRAMGTLGTALFPLVVLLGGGAGAWILSASLLMLCTAYGLRKVPVREGPVGAAGLTVFGVLYVGGLISFGVPLREGGVPGLADFSADRTAATLLFFYPVVVTWLADTAAYFGGRSLGRRKLAPVISPNKTIEGALSALCMGPVAALGYVFLLPASTWSPSPLRAFGFGLVISALAVVGDLVESAAKRERAVKDSSNLLPGHGGLLDRLDSLLWTLPGAYLFLVLVG